MKLDKILYTILESDVVSYINIIGGEIDGNQTKEKSLKLDAARVMDGSVRKNIEEFIQNFISGEINIKFVVDGKTVQLSTLKKDDKITFIQIDLNALDDSEFQNVQTNVGNAKIKFTVEAKSLKIVNSNGYSPAEFVTLTINIIKIVAANGSK